MGIAVFGLVLAGFLLLRAWYLAAGMALTISAAYFFIPADDYGSEITLLLIGVATVMLLVRVLIKVTVIKASK